jgi:hypothetical protein
MQLFTDQDWRESLEKTIEEWFASILEGQRKGGLQEQSVSEGAEPAIQIAALSVICECLAKSIQNLAGENRTDDELRLASDKAVELAAALSALWRTCSDAQAIHVADETPDQESGPVEDELSAEPNVAEEWLVSGSGDLKSPSENAPPDPPASFVQPVLSTPCPESPQAIEVKLSRKEQEKQLKAHLFDLQKAISWGNLKEAEKARKRVFRMTSLYPKKELEEKIKRYESLGQNFKRVSTDFETLMHKEGILGKKTITFWKKLPNSNTRWFINPAKKKIKHELEFQLGRLLRVHSPQSSRITAFIHRAQSAYGTLAAQLPGMRDAHLIRLPDVDPGVDHRIPALLPCTGWTLYIDETGSRFGDKKGKEGRVVGVLFPDNTTLSPLPTGFHAVSAPPAKVLLRFNQLLQTPCGILGLGVDDLHQMTQEHWLGCVLEVVNWVWRLLPLPGEETPVILNVLIENKGTYDASKDLEWLQTGLAIAWDKESPQRNSLIQLGKLDFVPKDTGLLGWVDLVAYAWGASIQEIKTGIKQSRLIGSCLLEGVRELLPIWAKAINGKVIEAQEWQRLTEEKDADRPGSVTLLALENLKKTCRQTPENWQRYVDGMNAYLAAKEYDLSVVETQANWLAGMEGINMNHEMRFFWKIAELARYNHTGEISTPPLQDTKAEVVDLSEKVGQLLPHARCHAMLRVAVSDANAFDFKRAEDRLAPWNPAAGGTLMGSAIWDGKILSSLGQYAAFQGYPKKGLPLFDQALGQFKRLKSVDPLEYGRQHSQTATYAAIAAMDAEGISPDDLITRMEQALGMPLLKAVERLGGDASPGNRYLHHLLVRYLAMHGSEKLHNEYLRTSSTWLIPEIGAGAGHPWPLIQYYRWELTKHPELIDSIFDFCLGREQGATVKLIGIAIGIASRMLSPTNGTIRGILHDLQVEMPMAEDRIAILLQPNSLSGIELLKRVLPFNYR